MDDRPASRTIRSPQDAEEAARDWLRWMGYPDAEIGPRGPDGGLDVNAREIVAQVKAHVRPVGRPVIQQTYGAAVAAGKRAAVFSLGGYSDQAHEFADSQGVALFTFDYAGVPEAVNSYAQRVAIDRSRGVQELLNRIASQDIHPVALEGALPAMVSVLHNSDPNAAGPIRWTISRDADDWIAELYFMGWSYHYKTYRTGGSVFLSKMAREGISVKGAEYSGKDGEFDSSVFERQMLIEYFSVPNSERDGRIDVSGGLLMIVPVEYRKVRSGVQMDFSVGDMYGKVVLPCRRRERNSLLGFLDTQYRTGEFQFVSPNCAYISHGEIVKFSPEVFTFESTMVTKLEFRVPSMAVCLEGLSTILQYMGFGLRSFDVDVIDDQGVSGYLQGGVY